MRRTTLFTSRPNAYFYAAVLRNQPRWHYQFAGALFLFSAATATYYYDQKTKKINPVILDYDYEQNPKKIDVKFIASLTKHEAIAFFTLAPFGVSPEAFSQHKKLFIQKKEISFLCFPIVLDITTSAALGACEALLKSGVVFDAAIKDIVEIKRRHQNSNYCLRLNAISHGLSTHYAMTFSDLQISLFNFPSFDSPGSPLTGDQIAALKVANNCDWFALWCVLRYLLTTKQESWANTVRIINGGDLKTKSPSFFSVGNTVPNANYINNVLYSRIFRDQAKKELNLSAAFLEDDCVWFNGDADVKALTKMTRENGFDTATAIKQLSALNGHQKWVIAVGGNIDEAKQMYVEKDHADIKRIPHYIEDIALKDLKVFRKDRAECGATPKL